MKQPTNPFFIAKRKREEKRKKGLNEWIKTKKRPYTRTAWYFWYNNLADKKIMEEAFKRAVRIKKFPPFLTTHTLAWFLRCQVQRNIYPKRDKGELIGWIKPDNTVYFDSGQIKYRIFYKDTIIKAYTYMHEILKADQMSKMLGIDRKALKTIFKTKKLKYLEKGQYTYFYRQYTINYFKRTGKPINLTQALKYVKTPSVFRKAVKQGYIKRYKYNRSYIYYLPSEIVSGLKRYYQAEMRKKIKKIQLINANIEKEFKVKEIENGEVSEENTNRSD